MFTYFRDRTLGLPAIWTHAGKKAFTTIAILLGATFVVILIGKLRLGLRQASRDWQLLIPLSAILGLIVVCVWVANSSLRAGTASNVLDKPLGTQLLAQGWLALISLFLANVLWMPVDLSTWQRIASVRSGKDLLENLTRGTGRVLWESPGTWMLGAVLGLTVSAAGIVKPGQDTSNALFAYSDYLSAGGIATRFLYPLFVAACVAVMFSTIDSIVSAISFTASRDLPPFSGKRRSARGWTLAIVLSGAFLYVWLRAGLGANLQTILYGAYSSQLSLIVVALMSLSSRPARKPAAIASILFGFVGDLIAVILAIHTGSDAAALLPPMFAIAGALAGYVFFYRMGTS